MAHTTLRTATLLGGVHLWDIPGTHDLFRPQAASEAGHGFLSASRTDAFVAASVIGAGGQRAAAITVQFCGAPHGFRRTTATAQGEFGFVNLVDAPVPSTVKLRK